MNDPTVEKFREVLKKGGLSLSCKWELENCIKGMERENEIKSGEKIKFSRQERRRIKKEAAWLRVNDELAAVDRKIKRRLMRELMKKG